MDLRGNNVEKHDLEIAFASSGTMMCMALVRFMGFFVLLLPCLMVITSSYISSCVILLALKIFFRLVCLQLFRLFFHLLWGLLGILQ